MQRFDVLIIGGGPAGLNAALVLGRSRRRVLVCDSGSPRNAGSRAMHGYLSRDGLPPEELRRLGREEIRRYGVALRDVAVRDVWRDGDTFIASLADGDQVAARRVILATGMTDDLPPIDGLRGRWGRSIFPCPYCDGWEVHDQPIATCAQGDAAFRYSLLLSRWSRDVVLCSNGPAGLDPDQRATLDRIGIPIREERITHVEGPGDALERIVFERGDPLARRFLFVKWGERQKSSLAARLGCRFDDEGCVAIGKNGRTNIAGVYAVGDASPAVQLVIVAAAEGAMAAVDIHNTLTQEETGQA